mmetsp:Transcript_8426/g.16175  ORF Transcript_8426/g.16175 Transcript_8426/m.16175 type:complete len:267 (-) Transcript_8426:190-990(-)
MRNGESGSTQCLCQSKIVLHEKISSAALESFVLADVDGEDQVTRSEAGLAGSGFTTEGDTLATTSTALDVEAKRLFLTAKTFSTTDVTLVRFGDGSSATAAHRTTTLDLLNHRTHLTDLNGHTATVASLAFVFVTGLGARAIAGVTGNLTGKSEILAGTLIDILKSDINGMLNILALLLTGTTTAAATTTTHEHVKNIHAIAATGYSFLDSFLTMLVIDLTLLFVLKDIISLVNLLELVCITTLIRMMLQSKFPMSLLKLIRSCIL